MKDHSRIRGFTLLEFLVSMTLFVLISGTAYGVLSTAGKLWERGDQQVLANTQMRFAFDYMRRQLSRVLPVAVPVDGRWRVWFEGEPHQVRFLVRGPRHVGLQGFYETVIYHNIEVDPPRIDLEMRRIDRETVQGIFWRTLLEGIPKAEFEYFGRPDGGDEAVWFSQWKESRSLPRLVRVRLGSDTTGEWPELTVRLPANVLRHHQF